MNTNKIKEQLLLEIEKLGVKIEDMSKFENSSEFIKKLGLSVDDYVIVIKDDIYAIVNKELEILYLGNILDNNIRGSISDDIKNSKLVVLVSVYVMEDNTGKLASLFLNPLNLLSFKKQLDYSMKKMVATGKLSEEDYKTYMSKL